MFTSYDKYGEPFADILQRRDILILNNRFTPRENGECNEKRPSDRNGH